METRKLHYFVQIVDAGSISRAADFLHLAQPALSQHIASLESEFGQRLLVRTRRGVSPTPEGLSLYRYAQGILRLERAAGIEIRKGSGGVSGYVSVGLGSFSCANEFGVVVLRKVQERYPNLVLHYADNLSVIFSQAIKMGLLDAAIIYDPGPIRGLRFEPIRTEDIYLVASPDLRVVEPGATEITLDEVSALELFLPQPQHVLRQIIDRGFQAAGLELAVRAEINPPTGLHQVVKAGLGATCLPKSVAEELFSADEFQILPIVEPAMSATFALCTSVRQPMSDGAAAVIELIRAEIAEARARDMTGDEVTSRLRPTA
ncbi:nitrogen assimilation transcriptional regulator NAC [Brooklawnia cerclae]|uniref:LysR family nitrogen assimilation transcriptional regulator n=1 Tax=Brooklawnia cerclae TaxID=349934 RepID=A0ABX0SGS8_9ACTN|nr:LysR substrate-binding domain-containing protein [Brooklawnia cerclae]NIH57598.1 LysR family nitrogen assimilation transcriptional regulator [Brooklawnia cerclae]